MNSQQPNIVCLDFDGTIMCYGQEPEHFHSDVIEGLNALADLGVRWIANSGRTFEGQWGIISQCVADRGLRHWPIAIMHSESFVHVGDEAGFASWDHWNDQARSWLRSVQTILRSERKGELQALIDAYRPDAVQYRDEATVFQLRQASPDARIRFIKELESILQTVVDAQIIHNNEWVAIVHHRLGKGNILRAYLAHHGIPAESVLAIGDHGNDLSMLDGSVTPHVACPGDAYPPVQEAVRAVGGYVADQAGAVGTVEAFAHYFPALTDSRSN